MRILFGDLEKYLDKFSTCARTRELGKQILGSSFYMMEHTKPLFNEFLLKTVQNLYNYYCILEIFKIMKFHTPIALYSKITLSKRGYNLTIILPTPSHHFLYKASVLWNKINKKLILNHGPNFDIKISFIKKMLKNTIFQNQGLHDTEIWDPSNFKL